MEVVWENWVRWWVWDWEREREGKEEEEEEGCLLIELISY